MVRLAALRAGSTLAPMDNKETTTNQIKNPVAVYVIEVEASNRATLMALDIRLVMGNASRDPSA